MLNWLIRLQVRRAMAKAVCRALQDNLAPAQAQAFQWLFRRLHKRDDGPGYMVPLAHHVATRLPPAVVRSPAMLERIRSFRADFEAAVQRTGGTADPQAEALVQVGDRIVADFAARVA